MRSNSAIIADAMQIFGISLKTAKDDLKEVYEHWASFSRENQEADKFKVLESLWEAVEQARQAFQYNAVIGGLREIAKIQGSYAPEKLALSGGVAVSSGAPNSGAVRSRIQALMADPKIRAKAQKLGLDLDGLDTVSSDSDDSKGSD